MDEGAKNKKIIQPSAAFCRFFPRRGSQLHEPLLASAEFQIQQRAGDEQRRAADSEIGGHADNVAQEEDIEQRRRDEYAPGGEKTDADAQAVLHHVDLVNVVELREAQVYHHAVERDEHRDDGRQQHDQYPLQRRHGQGYRHADGGGERSGQCDYDVQQHLGPYH